MGYFYLALYSKQCMTFKGQILIAESCLPFAVVLAQGGLSLCALSSRFVVVCGDGEYIIYTAMALRNKSFGSAQEFAWAHDSSE